MARSFRWVLVAGYAAGVLLIAAVLWRGRTYYTAPLHERPHHEEYWSLKPGGGLGLKLGAGGLALMTVMHAYSARKRLRPLRRAGPLARWLDFHILCGIFGPLLVVLHSSFKVSGLVSISFWSMVAVALSGVAGRYLYLQIPRSRRGDALSLNEATASAAALGRRLDAEFGLPPDEIRRLEEMCASPRPHGLLGALTHQLREDVTGAQSRRLRAAIDTLPLPPAAQRELRAVLAEKASLDRRLAMWDELHALFDHWHVVHKPFAIVMYLFVVVHVAVAAATGYASLW
jgi:hypothetical protein